MGNGFHRCWSACARVRARAWLVGALVLVALPGVGSAVALGQGGAGEVRHPAKLEVARNTIDRGDRRLDVLAPITKRASGKVEVELHAAGERYRFDADVNSAKGYIRFAKRIPRAQARLGTGIVTIAYPGNDRTRGQEVRLRAASRRAALDAQRPELVVSGGQLRLRSEGELSGRARGVVRVQLDWVDAGGVDRSYETNAKIDDGKWRLSEALPGEVRESIEGRRSTVHSYTLFTGYLRARMRGEMEAYQVLPAPPPVVTPSVGPLVSPAPAPPAPPPPAPAPPPPPEDEPQTQAVASDNVSAVPPPGQPGEVRVERAAPALEAGDYLATGVGPASPSGFLGEVTAVRQEGGNTVFSTRPAALIDAVPEGEINVAFEARADDAGSFGTQAAGTVNQPISKRVSCGTEGSVEITGSLSLDPSFSFQARWTHFRGVQDARFTGSVRADSELKATAQAASSCQLARTPLLAQAIRLRPVSVQVGPIPVVLVPVVQLYLSAEGTVQASVTTAVRGSMTATGGLSYQDGRYSPIASREVSFTHDAPTMDAAARLEARVGPTLNLLLYGAPGGPQVNLTAGLKLQANTTDNPWWTLTAPLRLDAALTVPSLRLSSGTINALDTEIPIANAGGPHPNTAPSDPAPDPGSGDPDPPQPPPGELMGTWRPCTGQDYCGNGISFTEDAPGVISARETYPEGSTDKCRAALPPGPVLLWSDLRRVDSGQWNGQGPYSYGTYGPCDGVREDLPLIAVRRVTGPRLIVAWAESATGVRPTIEPDGTVTSPTTYVRITLYPMTG